jgi:hypothetical protein
MTAQANFTEQLPIETKSAQEMSKNVARFFSTPEMLAEVGGLAKRAEWWGAPPQGRNVALFAECLAEDDLLGAMETRDEILLELNKAKAERGRTAIGVAVGGLGIAVFVAWMAGFFMLVVDPVLVAVNIAVSAGVDALNKP